MLHDFALLWRMKSMPVLCVPGWGALGTLEGCFCTEALAEDVGVAPDGTGTLAGASSRLPKAMVPPLAPVPALLALRPP